MNLKREELGRLTGFSLRALAEWASGKLPSQPAKRRLQEVRRLLDALAEIVKRESIPKWLHQPNPAFDRLTPLQVIEAWGKLTASGRWFTTWVRDSRNEAHLLFVNDAEIQVTRLDLFWSRNADIANTEIRARQASQVPDILDINGPGISRRSRNSNALHSGCPEPR